MFTSFRVWLCSQDSTTSYVFRAAPAGRRTQDGTIPSRTDASHPTVSTTEDSRFFRVELAVRICKVAETHLGILTTYHGPETHIPTDTISRLVRIDLFTSGFFLDLGLLFPLPGMTGISGLLLYLRRYGTGSLPRGILPAYFADSRPTILAIRDRTRRGPLTPSPSSCDHRSGRSWCRALASELARTLSQRRSTRSTTGSSSGRRTRR